VGGKKRVRKEIKEIKERKARKTGRKYKAAK